MLKNANVLDKPTTSQNPQANAICERMHQTAGNALRTLSPGTNIDDEVTAATIVDNALATTMHTLHISVSRLLDYNSPGALAFGRDMFLNLPLMADLEALRDRRQLIINQNLQRTNNRRRNTDHVIGQRISIVEKDGKKLSHQALGPFPMTQVCTNGTVSILKRPHVTQRINVRRITPCQGIQ